MDVGKGTGSICFSSPLIFFGLSFFLAFIPPLGSDGGKREKNRRGKGKKPKDRGTSARNSRRATRIPNYRF